MDRDRMRALLAEEFERSALPLSAARHIANLRAGKGSPGIEAALQAMQRAVDESLAEKR